jgi:cell division protein FtsB
MVTLLLAVVAISARGRPLGTRAGSGGALPFSFWDYVYTTIVIVIVPLFIAGLIAAAMVRRQQRTPRSTWQSLLRMLVLYCLFLGLELLVIRHLHLRPLPIPHPPQTETGLNPGQTATLHHHHEATQHRSLAFRWDELAIVLGLLVVVGAILVARLRRRDQQQAQEAAPEALAAALDESLDDLRNDPDLRRAIIAAYARMERALAAAGVRRHPAETPLEYLERVLLSLDTSPDAVRKLTELFEWARFSHHEPEPSMRDEAVDALNAVRDELRASELTPA